MSKVVLVMDMPDSCASCVLCLGVSHDGYVCSIPDEYGNERTHPDEEFDKPDWCPLVPVPEKKPCAGVDGIKSILLDERIKEGIKEAGAFGWNACIDAMTGEREEK